MDYLESVNVWRMDKTYDDKIEECVVKINNKRVEM
jgi:hypothetical protein